MRKPAARLVINTSFRFVVVGTMRTIALRLFVMYQQVGARHPSGVFIILFISVFFNFVGQTTSSSKLTDLTDDVRRRHEALTNSLNETHLQEIMKYILSKIMQGYPTSGENVPAIHFRIFYQVTNPSPANLIIKTLWAFKEATKTANIAFTVIPSCSLQNYGTFISICGIRHE